MPGKCSTLSHVPRYGVTLGTQAFLLCLKKPRAGPRRWALGWGLKSCTLSPVPGLCFGESWRGRASPAVP